MGQLVRLVPPKRRPPIATHVSPVFEEAWWAFPESGRLRSSKKLAWPEWLEAVREHGDDDMLARVRRYAAEDKEHKRECGAPAFHRWLKQGRWEHWTPPAPVEPAKFSDPCLRLSFFEKFKDERARSWFDRCALVGTELQSPHRFLKKEWLEGPFSAWAKGNGITGIQFK